MPQNLSPALVVCLALGLVATINAVLVLALTRGGTRAQIQLVRRAVRLAGDPWKSEREAIKQLHQRVRQLATGEPDPTDAAADPGGPDSLAPAPDRLSS